MKNILTASVLLCSVMVSAQSSAATFTPSFSDYPFPGAAFDVDAAVNTYYSVNYGLSISNAYLYKDDRDTFDGIGIANGLLAMGDVPNQVGRVDFLDQTDFVSLGVFALLDTTYRAFRTDGTLLSSRIILGDTNGSFTFNGLGSLIAYVTFATDGGFGAISGLTYNYDGNTDTDGDNDDIGVVPVPAALPLMASALGLFGISRKYKSKAM